MMTLRYLMSLVPLAFTRASAAVAPSLAAYAGVCRAVLMALWTVCLKRLPMAVARVIRPCGVLAVNYGLQMVRTDAMTDSAKMVEFESFRNCTATEGKSPTMSTDSFASAVRAAPNAEHSVSIRVDEGGPKPTRRGEVHLRPEANRDRVSFLERASTHVCIVTHSQLAA